MKANKLLLASLATVGLAGAFAVGCGGDDDDVVVVDGGVDGGTADAAVTPFGISNSGCYTVQTLTNLTDGCEIGLGLAVGSSFPATYNRMTAVLSLGRIVGSPQQPSLGSGAITFNMGSLQRNNTMMETGTTCTWNEVVSSNVTVTAADTFVISATDTQRTFSAGCTNPPPPAGGTCTSTWTWTVKKTSDTCADAGS